MLAFISYQPWQGFRIGSVPISPHGLGVMVGYLLAMRVFAHNGERRGIPRQETANIATWGFIGAVIGMRGFYILAHRADFSSARDMLAIWQGGLTLFGGMIGGLIAGIIYLRRKGIDLIAATEAAAAAFITGIFFGRIGDLIVADHLGRATRFFLGYEIPAGAQLAPGFGPPAYVPGAIVHQTALYDLIGVTVLAVVMWAIAKRTPARPWMWPLFCVWYGLQRFLIDFTRNRGVIESDYAGFSGSQIAALGFVLMGIAFWVKTRKTREPEPVAELQPSED